MKNIRILLLVVIVFVIAVSVSFIIYTSCAEEYKDWKITTGEIQQIEQLRKLNDRIYYTYTIDGKVYSGSELVHRSSHSDAQKAGDEISIWYDTDNPASSCYLKPNPTFQATAPIFLTVPICIIIVNQIKNGKRKQ